MKKTIFAIASVIILMICTSCGANENKPTNEEGKRQSGVNLSKFTKVYEGTISGKYEITMTLTRNDNILSGTYAYKSKGIPIKISGNIDDNGNLSIIEFNEKGSKTGVFNGQLNGTNIVGYWEKSNGQNKMPFSISESENTEHAIKINQSKSDNKREILSKTVGEHKLYSVSYLSGANTLGDFWIDNGKWRAKESRNHGGQREEYPIEITEDVLKKLGSMKIVVGQDLSISLLCNGKNYIKSQFNDNGMEIELSKTPNNYVALPKNLTMSSTIIENYLYILAKDNIEETFLTSINITEISTDVLVIKYDIDQNVFEVNMFWGECCDNLSYTFR